MTRYPNLTVQLTGTDGNAFMIVGRVRAALRQHLRAQGVSQAEVDRILTEFADEATSGDYDHVLVTCMQWVDVT